MADSGLSPIELGTPNVVEMRDLRKEFDGVVALQSVDLTIDAGEIVGIIGPSGSGKTTAIRLMLGLYEPTSGNVLVWGKDPASFTKSDREGIGYLPQRFLLYPELTVSENLRFIAGSYGLSWRTAARRIDHLLDLVGLSEAADRPAVHLSGGMQRRLALASALIHDPWLLVLDEPTAGIDPVLRSAIWDIFGRFRAEGRTLVVTTQYVSEAEHCDRVALISDGEVIAHGTPDELRKQAYGGELVRVLVPSLDRHLIAELAGFPFVSRVERAGQDDALLVVNDAGQAIPQITSWLTEQGHTVSSIEEHRVSFDQVFVQLVASEREFLASHP